MEEHLRLGSPLTDECVKGLKAGDQVLLSGPVYVARDAAHERLDRLIRQGKDLPFDPSGQVIYYMGPTPPKPGRVIGSAGPTTSSRMDPYTPPLIALGLKGMIGKGARTKEVIQAMKRHRAVYFAAIGGLGALISDRIKKSEIVAYEDLGTEALRRLEVLDFPLIVAIDCRGNNLYETGRKLYRKIPDGSFGFD
jgi:fumarate hydratase subunit beta